MVVSRWNGRWLRRAPGVVGVFLSIGWVLQPASGAVLPPELLTGFVNDLGEPGRPPMLHRPYRLPCTWQSTG